MHTHITSEAYEGLSLEQQIAIDALRLQIGQKLTEQTGDFCRQYPDVAVSWSLTIDAYPRKTLEAEKALLG